MISVIDKLKLPKHQLQNMLLYVENNYSMRDYDSYLGYAGATSLSLPTSFSNGNEKKMRAESVPDCTSSGVNDEAPPVSSDGNPYHNSLHGADVFQAVMYLIMKYQDIGGDFTPLDLFSILFGAYIHDFNHPGFNTTYVIADWPASGISTTFGTEVSAHLMFVSFHSTCNSIILCFTLPTCSLPWRSITWHILSIS